MLILLVIYSFSKLEDFFKHIFIVFPVFLMTI